MRRNSKGSLIRPEGLPDSSSWPVVTPLSPSVVYASESPDALDDQYEGRAQGFTYSREGHPNAQVVVARLDAMEGAEGGVVTGSGMGAVSAVLMGLLNTGDHVIGGNQLYGRSLRLMAEDLPRLGIGTTLADPGDVAAVEAAIRPETKMVLVEVLSNPTLRLADIDGLAALCKARGLLLVVDNTFTTPRAFRPFDHGADIVLHSITKLLAGHSDAMLGYVVAKDRALTERMRVFSVTAGLTPSPFDCWLAERGLLSFDLRFDRAEATAARLADHLAGLPGCAACSIRAGPITPITPAPWRCWRAMAATWSASRSSPRATPPMPLPAPPRASALRRRWAMRAPRCRIPPRPRTGA